MSGRVSGSWTEGIERAFAFRPPQPQSRRRTVLVSSILILIVISCSIFALYVDDAGQRWFMVALVLHNLWIFLSNTAEALYAGAFEGRFVEDARRLRAVAYVAAWFVGIYFGAAMGYYFASMSDRPFAGSLGALAGGAAGVIFLSVCMLYDLRRGRARAERSAGSER